MVGAAKKMANSRTTALVLLFLMVGAPARAGQLNAETFRAAEHPYDIFGVKTTRVAEGLQPGFGLLAHWGQDPLVFSGDVDGQHVRDELLADQLAFELFGSVAFLDRVDVAVALPLFYLGSSGTRLLDGVADASGFAIGDVRIAVKGSLLRHQRHGFGLGVDVTTSLPTARAGSYVGDAAVTVSSLLLLEYNESDYLGVVNLGWRLRSEDAVLDTLRVGHEMLMSAGFGLPLYAGLSAAGELQAATDAASPFSSASNDQLEGRLGLAYRFESGLAVEGGGGAAFLSGYGNVAARAFLGLRYEAPTSEAPVFADLVERPLPRETVVEPVRLRARILAPGASEQAVGGRDIELAAVAAVEEPEEAEPEAATDLPADRLTEAVHFPVGRERVPGRWRPILDEAARILKENPQITKVRVEGHTDAEWGEGKWGAANLRLSWRRARWVVAALVRRGVAPERLEALGLGDTRPLSDDRSKEGKAMNRRVELIVVEGR